jgi:carbon storage regulator
MLVLSRRIGETLFIGDDIRLTVLGITGGQVRLGIKAPDNVPVLREEIAPGGSKHVASELRRAAR